MASATKFGVLIRSLSTSSVVSQMVKPPIQVFGLEGRYATALYSAASKMQQLDAVEKDLSALNQALKSNPRIKEYIASPIVKRREMAAALKESGETLKMAAATVNLLQCLAENGRLKKLTGVINAFRTIMAAHRQEIVCEVTTAKPLDDAQRKKLESALKAFLKGGETLQISTKEDPTILGGMIVSIGDKYVDMSIASKVKRYTDVIAMPA